MLVLQILEQILVTACLCVCVCVCVCVFCLSVVRDVCLEVLV